MQVSIIWMILFIITIAAALITLLTLYLLKRNCLKNNLGIYLNVEETKKSGHVTMNIINIDKNPELANVNPKQLTLIMLGNKSEKFAFSRNPEIFGGIIAQHSLAFDTKDVVSFVAAVKYQKIEISADEGKTRFKVRSLKVKSINAVEEKFKKDSAKKIKAVEEDSVNRLRRRMENSDAEYYLRLNEVMDESKSLGMLCHTVESKATTNSIRHQLYIPKEHPYNAKLNPVENPITFYHMFNGFLYEIETNYLGMNGEVHKWELVGLEPGKIYVGLSYSEDGGKTIIPSTAVYGITKSKDGHLPVIDEADLGVPEPGKVKHKMYSPELFNEVWGEALARVSYSLIAKKHHENDHRDAYIHLENAITVCEEYPWIKSPMTPAEGEKFTKEEFDKAIKNRLERKEVSVVKKELI